MRTARGPFLRSTVNEDGGGETLFGAYQKIK
jgi:hypothetical protein